MISFSSSQRSHIPSLSSSALLFKASVFIVTSNPESASIEAESAK
jgi:hypothetical protein